MTLGYKSICVNVYDMTCNFAFAVAFPVLAGKVIYCRLGLKLKSDYFGRSHGL